MKPLFTGLTIALFAAITVLFLLGKKAEADPEPAYTPLGWYIDFEWFNRVWGEDLVSREIRSRTETQVSFYIPGSGGSNHRSLSMMIATKTLPDLITLDAEDLHVRELIESGLIYNLDELAERNDFEFYRYIDPEVYDHIRQPDGGHYFYPSYSVSKRDYDDLKDRMYNSYAFIVRKDIYEAIGKPDMTTPRGFLNALQAARDAFPETEGGPLIPLGFNEMQTDLNSLNFQLKGILGLPREASLNPLYLNWIKTFREAYQKGLIAPEIFIDNRAQIQSRIVKGRYFSMLYRFHDAEEALTELYTENPDMMYIAVPGPYPEEGVPPEGYYNLVDIDGWTVTMVARDSGNPDAAFRLMTFLMSPEGQLLIKYGVKGITWQETDGRISLIPEVEALRNTDRVEYNRIYGADSHYWMLENQSFQLRYWPQPLSGPLEQIRGFSLGKVLYQDKSELISLMLDEKVSDESLYLDDLKWNDTLLKLITSASEEEFEEILTEYRLFRKDLGLSDAFE